MSGNISKYNKLRNLVNKQSKRLQKDFLKTKVAGLSDTQPRKWWSSVKSMMGSSTPDSKSSLQTLASEHYAGDFQQLSNDLNLFFQEISSDLPRLEYKPKQTDPVPNAYIITVSDVEKRLMNIKINKAIGPDDIPNWVLRDCVSLLAPPLACIFNSCIREGYVPTMWKSALISPISKVYPPQNLQKDLRPIFLTPVIRKQLEFSSTSG